jgi:Ring finger domain
MDFLRGIPVAIYIDFRMETSAASFPFTDEDPVVNGLRKEEIENISEKIKLQNEKKECYICLDTLLKGSSMRKLNSCSHMFCIDCIDRWFSEHRTCPVCKTNVHVQTNET